MGMSRAEKEAVSVTEGERVMRQALKSVQLALSEVKVKQVWKDKVLVSEVVVNYPAIVRAREKYVVAAKAIGVVRQLLGLTHGKQRPEPKKIREANEELEGYRVELERLQGIS